MLQKFLLFVLTIALCNVVAIENVVAQRGTKAIKVMVSPIDDDWSYKTGDKLEFEIQVIKNRRPMKGVEVEYEIMPEKMESFKEGKETIKKESITVAAGKIKEPGFVTCRAKVEINGVEYSSYATAGFSPEKIKPTTELPNDFEAFWDNAKEELAEIPIKPVLTLMPERCTDLVNVYHVSFNNINGKVYGILCKPKKSGKYPAILHVPGAGIRPYGGDIENAEKGFITLQIGIHGIPVNLDPVVYSDLRYGALNGYWVANLDDKDNYYYKRVYLGCVRSVDFIYSLEEFDGVNIGVTGGSQGGALSIITASLDKRIKYLAALYPALSDLTGYLHDRAGGWPHMFRNDFTNKADKIETSKYYDVVNFARFISIPGWYSWGYNDPTCPPTSMYSAYNVINAPKELHLFQETGHWAYPEQHVMRMNWITKQLLK